MACFLVSAAEAVAVTVAVKIIEKNENKTVNIKEESQSVSSDISVKTPFSRKLKWLRNLLWGGSVLLAFEHLWHGEIVPWFPFLTAASDPADAAEMLKEMSTVGVSMALLVTLVWVVMLVVSYVKEKRAAKAAAAKN